NGNPHISPRIFTVSLIKGNLAGLDQKTLSGFYRKAFFAGKEGAFTFRTDVKNIGISYCGTIRIERGTFLYAAEKGVDVVKDAVVKFRKRIKKIHRCTSF